MTDKEKRAIEMFYGNEGTIKLYNMAYRKYFNYISVDIGLIVCLQRRCADGYEYDNIDCIDLDPPKTAFDEYKEMKELVCNIAIQSSLGVQVMEKKLRNVLYNYQRKYESQLKEIIEVEE
jgi:hypothetical protein